MLLVADTSALIALAACDGLHLLDELFDEVCVPPAVFEECTVTDKPHSTQLRRFLQSKITPVNISEFVIAAVGLGAGELEAMALFKRLDADRLLLDDDRARRVAKINHIKVVGSVGILILAKTRNLISTLKPRLDSIQSAGVYISESLMKEALRLAGEAQ